MDVPGFHLVWGIAGILGTTHGNAAVFWSANLLIALGFGATHLVQARALHGLTASYVAFIFLLNGVASLAFGWVYYRQGLVAAMAAHTFTDLVLQMVVAPMSQRMSRRP
ncbi:MAG: CPBP family intramembrane metalloprotease [Acidobacteriia bacterium]|nr:CPBP family intramembrane metalloprotease [Terriglobia bacterium]